MWKNENIVVTNSNIVQYFLCVRGSHNFCSEDDAWEFNHASAINDACLHI